MGLHMMQAEIAFARVTGENKAKENICKGRSISPNTICLRCGDIGHIAWNFANNIEVNHAQDEENNEGNGGDKNLVMC